MNTEAATQPEKIMDFETGEMVPNPEYKAPEADQEDDRYDPGDGPEGEEEEEESEETEEESGSEGEESEEESEEQEEEEQEEDGDDLENVLEPDEYFKEVFHEKYGVNSQDDLEKLLDGAIDIQGKYKDLIKEVETLKAEAGKPKFDSDAERKAFEFIKSFDINNPGKSFETFAKVVAMDVDTADDMLVLEERFVLEHPEWTRQEAQRMFQKEFNRKYNPKADSFDSEDEYKSEMEDLAILKKGEVARARAFLKEKQATHKPKPKEEEKGPSVPEAVTRGIEKNTSEYTELLGKTDEIAFERGSDKFSFKLDKTKKEAISEALSSWVKNPANYAKDGQLKDVKSLKEILNRVVGFMYMDEIVNAITDQVKNSVNIKRVEDIAKRKPAPSKGVSGKGDTTGGGDDLLASASKLLKKRQASH